MVMLINYLKVMADALGICTQTLPVTGACASFTPNIHLLVPSLGIAPRLIGLQPIVLLLHHERVIGGDRRI